MFDFSDFTGFFARKDTLQFGFCFIGESDNNSELLISDVYTTVKDSFFGKISELKRSEVKYHGDNKDVIDYIYRNPYISKIVERFGNEKYITLS